MVFDAHDGLKSATAWLGFLLIILSPRDPNVVAPQHVLNPFHTFRCFNTCLAYGYDVWRVFMQQAADVLPVGPGSSLGVHLQDREVGVGGCGVLMSRCGCGWGFWG